jgi:hypothetical protein
MGQFELLPQESSPLEVKKALDFAKGCAIVLHPLSPAQIGIINTEVSQRLLQCEISQDPTGPFRINCAMGAL